MKVTICLDFCFNTEEGDDSAESSVVEETEEEEEDEEDDENTVYESDRAGSPTETIAARGGTTGQASAQAPAPLSWLTDGPSGSR